MSNSQTLETQYFGAAAPLQLAPKKRTKVVNAAESPIPQPLRQTGDVFSQHSHEFQKYSTMLSNIQQRVNQRAADGDERTQLAVRAADSDAIQAVEAARYFLEIATRQQNSAK